MLFLRQCASHRVGKKYLTTLIETTKHSKPLQHRRKLKLSHTLAQSFLSVTFNLHTNISLKHTSRRQSFYLQVFKMYNLCSKFLDSNADFNFAPPPPTPPPKKKVSF